MGRIFLEKSCVFLLAIVMPVLFLSLFTGCAAPATMNPYAFLDRVDSVDHTPFFIATYDAFQAAGLDVFISSDQTTQVQEQQETQSTQITIPNLTNP
jgi:hypothetical protein